MKRARELIDNNYTEGKERDNAKRAKKGGEGNKKEGINHVGTI